MGERTGGVSVFLETGCFGFGEIFRGSWDVGLEFRGRRGWVGRVVCIFFGGMSSCFLVGVIVVVFISYFLVWVF